MTRYMLALPGALAVTVILAFLLGHLLGERAGLPVRSEPTEAVPGGTPPGDRRPERPERAVRHVYAVPVWDPGPVTVDPQSLAPDRPVIEAWPLLAAGYCRIHLDLSQAEPRLERRACSDEALYRALRETLETWSWKGEGPGPRGLELSVRAEPGDPAPG